MRCFFLAAILACGSIALFAQKPAWEPAPGHQTLKLWPKGAPGAPANAPAEADLTTAKDGAVAGKPVIRLGNVSSPTLTVYQAKNNISGAAVLVFPGGGYHILAIDLEGTEVCDWLTSRGITCVLLKYRVPDSGPHWVDKCKCQVNPKAPMALQDAQRTMGLLRARASAYHVDPRKIGVLGFSAGGHLSADISTHFDKRVYPPLDAADRESCRPDFAVVLYPGHLWVSAYKNLTLNPDVPVTRRTPPTFIVQAENDPVDSVNNSLVYYIALENAGVPVEMHLYAEGKHAFGLRRTSFPITRWPELVETWLRTIGIVNAGR